MASMEEPTFPLRLFVDKERNEVVLAEASGDFIDILFSFLTLPLGTIIRLVSNKQPNQSANIGCINNLYRAVENMNGIDFQNHICKEMLLFPRNPCESICEKLKMNVDDTARTRFFMCRNYRSLHECLLNTFEGMICACGRLMNQEMKVVDSKEEKEEDGVFVKGKAVYLIFDDLKVMQSSLGNSVQQLVQLSYKGFNQLKEMSPNIGYKEMLELLKQALISRSPLTDVFLGNGIKSKPTDYSFSPKLEQKFELRNSQINVKITTSKSKNKILYAEAEEDFIDFLFSFLTMPLGSILNLLDGNSSVGSIDNLYKSVRALNPSWCTKSCTMLLNPGVAPLFGCKNQPLQIHEQEAPIFWFGDGVCCNNICYKVNNGGMISRDRKIIHSPRAMRLFDPRSADGARERAVGFVKRPAIFAVCDDLQVIPLTSASSISFLQKLNVSLDDLDEHVVGIGETEALQLLRASLTSKSALTEGLFFHFKKPEEAPC